MNKNRNIIFFVLVISPFYLFSSEQNEKLIGIAAARKEAIQRGYLKESFVEEAPLSDFEKMKLAANLVVEEATNLETVTSSAINFQLCAQSAVKTITPMIAHVAPAAASGAFGTVVGGIASVLGNPWLMGGLFVVGRYQTYNNALKETAANEQRIREEEAAAKVKLEKECKTQELKKAEAQRSFTQCLMRHRGLQKNGAGFVSQCQDSAFDFAYYFGDDAMNATAAQFKEKNEL